MGPVGELESGRSALNQPVPLVKRDTKKGRCGGPRGAGAQTRHRGGPEHSPLAGVQAAMVGVDGDLTLWSKGATEVLEQEQAECGSHLGELVQTLV